eukprot:11155813-Lingulodinium_polyedra.AAC.1
MSRGVVLRSVTLRCVVLCCAASRRALRFAMLCRVASWYYVLQDRARQGRQGRPGQAGIGQDRARQCRTG